MKYFKFLFFVVLILVSCNRPNPSTEYSYSISTMGTNGTIKYLNDTNISKEVNEGIDSVLIYVNNSMSTYIPDSEISIFNKLIVNQRDSLLNMKLSDAFKEVLTASELVYVNTNGAFNPLVKPLIDYWGFGTGVSFDTIDSVYVESLLKCTDFDLFINLSPDNTDSLCFQLDFSAIAKGYGVDVVANFLETMGIENYMVEIGGEVNCKGKNIKNSWWRMGIEKPNEETRELYEVVEINNRSLATSGNYRNFRVLDSGQKVVHIVNPKTGYSVESNLLSATIFAENCMLADAYATACMVMGLDDCFKFIDSLPNVDAYLIYSNQEGLLEHMFTKGIENDILMIEK